MLDLLCRGLGLERSELRRAIPFFLVYLLLFMALTVADGVAVSLFAGRLGADRLPAWYAMTAVISLVLIGIYLTQATRRSGGQVFGWILGTLSSMFLAAWAAYRITGGTGPLGMLFVTREIAMTMVLMHFGTFLQDFFLRSELNRMLPIIYAGGRVGGIVGGAILVSLSERIGTIQLVPGLVAVLGISWLGILWITRTTDVLPESDELAATLVDSEPPQVQRSLPRSVANFVQEVLTCPLLRWLTLTTLAFIICRWFLAFQYTSTFETQFVDDVALAGFMGRYTQVALSLSLVLQLFVVNRLVKRFGISGTYGLYSGLVAGGLFANVFSSGLGIAVACRFIETELRFGLRNPVNQMMVNRFSKPMRIVVRGWSLGWLIPVGTLIAAGMIAALRQFDWPHWVAIAGVAWGAMMLATAIGVGRAHDAFTGDRRA